MHTRKVPRISDLGYVCEEYLYVATNLFSEVMCISVSYLSNLREIAPVHRQRLRMDKSKGYGH